MMTCEGKTAIVTGAAGKGIGRSVALTLAREGAKVVVNYRNSESSALEMVGHIRGQGGQAVAVKADVFVAAECRALYEKSCEAFGHVDICIIGPGGGWHPEPPDKLNAEGALLDVQQELAPIYHLLPLVLPGMYERKSGRVVAIGLEATKNSPAYAYNLAKVAREQAVLMAMRKAWKHNVTLNVVGPGPLAQIATLAEAVELCGHGPVWRNRKDLTAQDVAEGIAFLCSEAGQYVSGCVLPYVFHN